MAWFKVVLLVQIINVVLGDPGKWTRTKPSTTCSGQDQLIKFTYDESFDKFSSVTWSFKPKDSDKSQVICFYLQSKGFQLAAKTKERYEGRIEWENKTLSFKLKNLSVNDSGVYDVQFAVINSISVTSKTTNSSFRLDVKDPCVTAKTVDSGCTEVTCSTKESNPQYSWNEDAAGVTTGTVKVCPKTETKYTCCIDAQKTMCMDFQVAAADAETTAYPTTTITTITDDKKDSGGKTGIIVGIVVAVVVVIGVIIGVIFYCRSRGGYSAARTSD